MSGYLITERGRLMSSPKKKFKSFTYENTVSWVGDRAGTLSAEGMPEFRVASPPEFKGEEGVWSPEDLFVASVNVCTLTTFLAFAYHKDLPLESYESSGEGLLERVESGFEFTKVIIRPTILVASREDVETAEQLVHRAHEKCLISNSIKGEVVIEPDIRVAA